MTILASNVECSLAILDNITMCVCVRMCVCVGGGGGGGCEWVGVSGWVDVQ